MSKPPRGRRGATGASMIRTGPTRRQWAKIAEAKKRKEKQRAAMEANRRKQAVEKWQRRGDEWPTGEAITSKGRRR